MDEPIVASYCTTFLKPEMLHIYRQVTGLQRYRTVVLTKEPRNRSKFPFEPVITLPWPRSNFVRRFYLKYVVHAPPIFYRGEFQVVRAALARVRADLVHVYFGHTGVHLLPLLRAWDKPSVVSFHGADVMPRDDMQYMAALRGLFDTVPLVLARSQSLADRLEAMGCPREKIRINRTGIPLEKYPLLERSVPADGAWRLVQACRLIAKKGIPTALRAFARFRERWPRARFAIAGEGPMEQEIRALIGELGLCGSVELTGFLSEKKLSALFAESHAFVHPSQLTRDQNQEGVPNAMLEAMATGLPVLATFHGGIPEAVTDGETGWLVAERNHDALAAAMLRMADAPERWQAMGRAASASVRVDFEQGAQIERLESYYDEARGLRPRELIDAKAA